MSIVSQKQYYHFRVRILLPLEIRHGLRMVCASFRNIKGATSKGPSCCSILSLWEILVIMIGKNLDDKGQLDNYSEQSSIRHFALISAS